MCGIAGEIRFDGKNVETPILRKMAESLRPRGPEAMGFYAQDHLGFAHTRLKIMDLSQQSQQPQIDSHLGLGIVFNGAIYNYPQLKKDLESKGYVFFSDGDTEVLLKAYHCWGKEALHRLSGMFAFAIWERDTGKVFLARDRLGIKPLYLHRSETSLLFSSTLPSLMATGRIAPEIDRRALHNYLSFHSVVPAPRTIFSNIQKLPAATWMEVSPQGEIRVQPYWRLSFPERKDETKSFDFWRDGVEERLLKAIERRNVADVPVGVLLSGGLDSSLIVGLLSRGLGKTPETYSIGFESVGDTKGDEFIYSDRIAEAFSTKHHKIVVDPKTTLATLDAVFRSQSEPMVSHDNVGFHLLAREVSKTNKAVQSGQGADEVFAGYHWYPPLLKSADPFEDYKKLFFDRDHRETTESLNPDFHGEDASSQFVSSFFSSFREEIRSPDPLDPALCLDTTVMLVEDPVKRVDNMTMAFGLECRVPFLDHELVEYAAHIPSRFKVRDGGKYVLKEIGRKYLPHEVIDRPKGYFPVPALKYLRGEFLDYAKESLLNGKAASRGLFRASYVEKILQEPEAHITPLGGAKLWQLAALERWLQLHGW